jgi:hypothetical protein
MKSQETMTEWRERSDELHGRVQAYIRSPAAAHDDFEHLALEIAAYQAEAIPAYARLVRARGSQLDRLESIPAVPVEAFRLSRVAAHPAEFDSVRFQTSGTTSAERGQHCMRRTDSYRLAAVTWGRPALVPLGADGATVICLAPKPTSPQSSSLGFMMQAFLEQFDPEFDEDIGTRWLLSGDGVDLDGLRGILSRALAKPRPVLVLATSFALVYLIDALDGSRLPTDGRAVVMQTGGFKGKSRTIAPDELRRSVASVFGIAQRRVVSEYGMTELSSQLYEDTLNRPSEPSGSGWYVAPPWLKVDAVDPVTLANLPDGQIGLACFTDLANVDSAVRILTEDRIVRDGARIQLLGRSASAPARGCSLADEELISPC